MTPAVPDDYAKAWRSLVPTWCGEVMRPIHAALLFPLVFTPRAVAQSVLFEDSSLFGIDDVEITPDGRLAIVRENTIAHTVRVYDLATASLVTTFTAPSEISGTNEDAVAVSNDRAVVIGSRIDILDVSAATGPALLASYVSGSRARDVAMSPDGRYAVVRGGPAPNGGSFVLELAGAALVAAEPGDPTPYDLATSFEVDSAIATDLHAATTSYETGGGNPFTRLRVWRLPPNPATPPPLVLVHDLDGPPHDLAVNPVGSRLAMRTETSIGFYQIDTFGAAMLWSSPVGAPAGFQGTAMDSVEVTADRIVTLSRITPPTPQAGTQVDVFDYAGTRVTDAVPGVPHDLAVTADGRRAVVSTSSGVYLYDLTVAPAPSAPVRIGEFASPSTSQSYFAGLDSVAVTNRRAVAIRRSAPDLLVHFFDIGGRTLELIGGTALSNEYPSDVAITPDGSKAVVAGTGSVAVFLLATGSLLLDYHLFVGYPTWSDGVAVNDTRAVAVGYSAQQSGWVTILDITPPGTIYCAGAANSVGPGARIRTAGSTSLTANDLRLEADAVPVETSGAFVYGTSQGSTPFGNGLLCFGLVPSLLPSSGFANVSGALTRAVDWTDPSLPVLAPGATVNFQFMYRDVVGAGFNLSNAVSVTLAP